MTESIGTFAPRELQDVPESSPLVGFKRLWLVKGRLRGHWQRSARAWESATARAECGRDRDAFGALLTGPHDAPDPDCGCGLSACHDAGDALGGAIVAREEVLIAIVAGWGHAIVDRDAFRCRQMRILALSSPPQHPRLKRARARRVAHRHGVRYVPWTEMNRLAQQLGPPLDAAARDAVPAPPVVDVPRIACDRWPAFRFELGPTRGRVTPYHDGPHGARERGDNPRRAIGEILALDSDRAIATFAHVPPDLRAGAERVLRDWAHRDDWQLEIAPGHHPLLIPPSEPTVGWVGLCCARCRHATNLGLNAGMALVARGFLPTRCGRCGGRESILAEVGVWRWRATEPGPSA